ncbi:MAG: hypothetical protein AB7O37_12680 [Vicinamibacteria bacterium]
MSLGSRHRLVGLLLVAACLAGAPGRAGDAAQARAAQALQARLDVLEKSRREGRPPAQKSFAATEEELNSYLARLPTMPPSLSGVRVKLEKDRVAVNGLLDLDQLQGKLPTAGGMGALGLFSGKVEVALKGRLSGDEGFGRVELEEASVGALPLSPALLAPIVAQATRGGRYPEGFDIQSPFRLPYSARRLRVQTGRAVLEF